MYLSLCVFKLNPCILQLFGTRRHPFLKSAEGVIQSLNIAEDVRAQRDRMPQLMNQCDLIFPAEGVEGQLHIEATVLTDGNRIGACHGLAKPENSIAGGLLFSYRAARHKHRREAVLVGLGISFSLVNIRTIALNALLQRFDFLRKLLQNLILQSIALAQMVGLEQLQARHINVQIMR